MTDHTGRLPLPAVSRARRNPVRGQQPMYVAVIAAASGVLAAAARMEPTGSVFVDVLLVAGAAAAVTWAAATAPWWLVAAVSLLAAGLGSSPIWVAAGLVGVALACVIGAERRNMPWARSLAVLLAVQVLARCKVGLFFGASALVACVALAIVFVAGVRRRPSTVRRTVWRAAGASGLVAAVALVGFAIAALVARAPLQEGNRQARAGLDALNRGDIAASASAFRASAQSFRRADDALTAPWAQPARLVPVAAQHRDSLSGLTADAADALAAAASALAQVNPDTLRVINGRIDVGAVRALETPFVQLEAAIVQLQNAVAGSESEWLVGPLQSRLRSLGSELAKNQVRADNALLAVRVAPRMLGADGLRRYFIAFTTPAEARGLGGFMGNWAELTIDNGKIAMTQFGRHTDLNSAGDMANRKITGLEEFVRHWGRFGFANAAGGTADAEVWSNLTMAPDFPTVAQVISQLYPQSGGQPLDGVFVLDPQAIAALMSFTGPIEVAGLESPLTAENAAQFIIKDQYLIEATDQRIDLLESVARATVDKLLSSSLPPPAELAREFAPLAVERRLMAWSADAEEEALLTRVKMDGAFPQLAGADGVAVTVDNGGGNKIDAYLDVTVDRVVTAQGADGRQQATVTVTLTNSAPAAGLPDYVIGNLVNLPKGTNRTWLSVYTALPMVGVEVDGVPDGMQTDQVFGWNVASRFVEIPAEQTVTVTLMLDGVVPDANAPLVTAVQPLTRLPTLRSSLSVPT